MTFRACMLAATIALAVSPVLAAEKPKAQPSSERTKKICRVSVPTGSRLGGVARCKTQAEWDQARAEARQKVDSLQAANPGCLKGDPQHGPVC